MRILLHFSESVVNLVFFCFFVCVLQLFGNIDSITCKNKKKQKKTRFAETALCFITNVLFDNKWLSVKKMLHKQLVFL